MAYFAPYIDGSGLHMPTYEDRLAALVENYRSIFGLDSELSESVPDYQLLSVFARSLDDASSLVLSAFHQMNPMYASGQALDLLLPQYGISRLPGETDASVRSRIVTALAGNGRTMEQNIIAEVMKVPSIKQATMFVNDTNSTDAKGIPAHSICVVAFSGSLQKIAEAIFRKKPPGIGTYGGNSKTVVDENGVSHTIYIQRPTLSIVAFNITIKTYAGFDNSLVDVIKQAIVDYIEPFPIGQSLIVPSVYGVCYAAAGEKASTFAITDLEAVASAAGGSTRVQVPADWKTKLDADAELISITLTQG